MNKQIIKLSFLLILFLGFIISANSQNRELDNEYVILGMLKDVAGRAVVRGHSKRAELIDVFKMDESKQLKVFLFYLNKFIEEEKIKTVLTIDTNKDGICIYSKKLSNRINRHFHPFMPEFKMKDYEDIIVKFRSSSLEYKDINSYIQQMSLLYGAFIRNAKTENGKTIFEFTNAVYLPEIVNKILQLNREKLDELEYNVITYPLQVKASIYIQPKKSKEIYLYLQE